MSQTIEQEDAIQDEPVAPIEAEPAGEDDVRERFAHLLQWNYRHMMVAIVFCLFFLFNNYMRLFYSDIWGHVAYGNWIVDHESLPTEEPFVKLAEGMEVMCTAWGSQVLLALGGRWGGAEAYSAMFAISITLTYLVLARVCYLQTKSIGLSVLAALLAWGVNWGRHAVIRPEMFGGLCFALLLWLVVRSDAARSRSSEMGEIEPLSLAKKITLWLGVPVLFAAWANLHGSFVVGFAVLGAYALGRGVELLWKERRLGKVLADPVFRRWLLLTELAVLASMINPYGFDLLLHTALFPSNPNLVDIVEWFPLEMVSVEGITVGASWLLLLIAFRHSRARVAVSDVILLAVFSLAVCVRVRMIAWYGPVWMFVIAPHLNDILLQLKNSPALKERYARYDNWAGQRSSRIFMFGGLAIWLTFAFSPVSTFVLDAKPREPERQYHGDTPLGITEYLRENPPEGMIANPQWWGDWLSWQGPRDLEVMMTTNAVHVVPPKVWRDYLAISAGQAGLESRLAKYRINTIVVHKELQANLYQVIQQSLGWKIVYEDDLGLVAVRTQPVNEEEQSPESTTEES